MPRYLPIAEIRSMPYTDLARWWEVDFDVLTTTAIAEATGAVHPTVTEALHSDDWIEQWADALYAASGELASAVERMLFTGDERFEKTKKQAGLVASRVSQVNGMLRDRNREQGWRLFPDHQKDARKASLSILSRYYAEEAQELEADEKARRGLAPHNPLRAASYADKFDAIEDAVARGLITAPVTPPVQSLLDLPLPGFTSKVANDVSNREEPLTGLRHPLLLRRWAAALEALRDKHCPLAGISPTFSMGLPRINMRDLHAMDVEEARRIINRRRFIRALAQRNRECQMHIREVVRAVVKRQDEVKRPWREAIAASRERLAERHPEQMEALLAAFKPFCVPGSTELRREHLRKGGPVTTELIPSLKESLRDGTWRRFLDSPIGLSPEQTRKALRGEPTAG